MRWKSLYFTLKSDIRKGCEQGEWAQIPPAINIHVVKPNLNEMPLKSAEKNPRRLALMHFNLIIKNALAQL